MRIRPTFNHAASFTLCALGATFALPACSEDNGVSQGSGAGGQAGTGGTPGNGGMMPGNGGTTPGNGGMTPGNGGTPAAGGATTGGASGMGGASGGGGMGGASGGGGMGGMGGMPMLPPATSYIAGGNFAPLPAYMSSKATGHALAVRDAMGKTTVWVHAEGLTAMTTYPAHVHNLPCAVNTGGDHYKIDPANTMTDPANEFHMMIMTDANGIGRATVNQMHFARPDAQSVVIHDPASMPTANAKMLCADLLPEPVPTVTTKGTFAPFASAAATDKNIAGTATMVRDTAMMKTTVTLDPMGLDMGSMYMAHVHQFPCAVTTAGGHYKIDPTNMMTDMNNELWPSLMSSMPLTSMQVARPDAQSVVIHRMDSTMMSPPKVACADLVRMEAFPPFKTEGTGTLFMAGMTKFAMGTLKGTMTRTFPMTTDVTVEVTNFGKMQMYPVHVHEFSCANQSAGGHYEIDPTMMAGQSNEIWLPIMMTDGNGAGSAMVSITNHLARPEAASIVVHDNDTNKTKLGCIDLK